MSHYRCRFLEMTPFPDDHLLNHFEAEPDEIDELAHRLQSRESREVMGNLITEMRHQLRQMTRNRDQLAGFQERGMQALMSKRLTGLTLEGIPQSLALRIWRLHRQCCLKITLFESLVSTNSTSTIVLII